MKTGPTQPAAIAPARQFGAYSKTRCQVYVCSDRASSRMTGPTPFAFAVSKIVLAVSKVSIRMLIAGTVRPANSPRARAA